MILVLLGTQNNSFHRLLEEIDKLIQKGTIKDEVIVQAGYTKYQSSNMEILDFVKKDQLEEMVKKANLIITHGGVRIHFTIDYQRQKSNCYSTPS